MVGSKDGDVSFSKSAASLALLAVLMSIPFAVAGPGLYLDDWFSLRNATFHGWSQSAGPEQWAARPVAAAAYALTFGLMGEAPLAFFVVAMVLMLGSAMLILVIARRFAAGGLALMLAGLWLLLPNHTSLEMWPSAINIVLALFLLLVGLERLTPADRACHTWLAAVAFGLSVLAYEATAPAAITATLANGAFRGREHFWRVITPPVLVVTACLAWMAANWHPGKQGLGKTMEVTRIFPAHFGNAVFGPAPIAMLVGVAVLLGFLFATVTLAREDHRGRSPAIVWWVPFGTAVVALGTVPFARYHYEPLGLGDRVTVVSGVGSAVVLVGLLGWIGTGSRLVATAIGGVLVLGMLHQRAQMVSSYAQAAADGRAVLEHVDRRWSSPPPEPIVFGPSPIVHDNVTPFFKMQWPLQRLFRTAAADGVLTFDAEAFEQAPASLRVDLREVSAGRDQPTQEDQ